MKEQRMARLDDRTHNNTPDAHIPMGASFVGDIETKAGIRVDGSVKGHINAAGNVDVGPDGKVQGSVKGSRIHIAGSIRGNVTSSAVVQLVSGARLSGDLSALSLSVEEGASYKGQCVIGKQPEEIIETHDDEKPTDGNTTAKKGGAPETKRT